MKRQNLAQTILIVFIPLAILTTASAHIGYNGRNFGVFNGTGSEAPVVITNQNVTGDYGWADGTDSDFGDTHKLRAFRFTLNNAASVTIQVSGLAFSSLTALEFPAFSLYSGLAHLPPAAGDHDTSVISTAWMNFTFGAGTWEGVFNALGDWKIGNDDGVTFADLSSLTYLGNAADGTPLNFGSSAGINGDGVADGTVTGTFNLTAGDYSFFVGGGLAAGTAATTSYGLTSTLTVVPEPTSAYLLAAALLTVFLRPLVPKLPLDKCRTISNDPPHA